MRFEKIKYKRQWQSGRTVQFQSYRTSGFSASNSVPTIGRLKSKNAKKSSQMQINVTRATNYCSIPYKDMKHTIHHIVS